MSDAARAFEEKERENLRLHREVREVKATLEFSQHRVATLERQVQDCDVRLAAILLLAAQPHDHRGDIRLAAIQMLAATDQNAGGSL
ncbi:hypothetical protein [Ensifer soli]|uniref:hypothetical protein n=1 Tax=Ciceribacter sp. sgz301302 TaxID=3342379 RepID=UPI0035BB77C1